MQNVCGLVFDRTSAILFIALALSAWQLVALNPNEPLNRYGRQTWQIESGLPQNTIHAIVQTHDGYLWLATEGGLARFDGLNFLVFDTRNTPQLRSNNIRTLLEDRAHSLWIGTAEGLTRFNGSMFQTFTTQEGLPGNNIWSIYQSDSGNLWVLTQDGLTRYGDGRFQTDPSLERSSIRAGGVTGTSNGSLWIDSQGLPKLFSDGQLTIPAAARSLPHVNVEALLKDASGGLWFGTSAGLFFCNNSKVTAFHTSNGLPSNRISALYQDRQGTVWVGTDSGLARIVNNQIQRVPAYDSSLDGIILCMMEDREGSLWLGTESGGLTVLRDEKFTTYTTKDGLSNDLVRCTFQDRKGTIWAGTNNGLNHFTNKGFSTFTAANHGLSSDVILALAEDAGGKLLVGTPDGLNILANGAVSVITSADGLADDFIRSIYRDSDNSLWIGTRHGLTHWQNGKFQTYTQTDGLGSDLTGAVLRDRRNNLWIATLHGLTRYTNGTFRNYTTADGLSSEVISALFEDSRGILWIGTQGGGLNRFDGQHIFHYSPRLGLPDSIYSILSDPHQNLWITSQAGIFRSARSDLDALANGRVSQVAVASYGTADGLKVRECSGGGHPAAWAADDGSLWFATLKGIATVSSQQSGMNSQPPPVVLESITVDDQVFNPATEIDVAPGHSRYAFEYGGLSFVDPHSLQFRYKLEGFDRNWVDAGTRRVAYYTNIAPGTYQFQVTARNNESAWNAAGTSFAFRVRPHFYQTYWFDFLAAVAVVLAGWEIYRWRVKQVEARFSAVLAERNRIAREIHDSLAQGFVAVSVQLELLARIIDASNGAAQDLLRNICRSVQESLTEARRSIWELRSQGTSEDDLPSRLSKLATQVMSATPLKVQFQVLGTYRPLPSKVENELLKIGQEAVANVIRHADARNVNIDLSFEARKLRLAIADDGRGFEKRIGSLGLDGHFGLRGMQERADEIDAKLVVKSGPGEGTRVTVEKVIN